MANQEINPKAPNHNVDFKYFMNSGNGEPVKEKTRKFSAFMEYIHQDHCTYQRLLLSPTGPRVLVNDPFTGKKREMVMFGSNNYLGFANHPYVKEKVKKAIDQYGVGIGGPPLLNGYTKLMCELEERLAGLKGKESAMVFSTGYSTNIGLVTALVKPHDLMIYDALSHASFLDAMRMAHNEGQVFRHNDVSDLIHKLETARIHHTNAFVGVEGVYSMDGDLAPLDQIVPAAKNHDAMIMLDDAHGTGVLGARGSGTAEHFNCEDDIDIIMGTFSKVFAVTGGFLAGSSDIINYIRFLARSYMFSASLTPVTLAAVLAGIDLIDREPERRKQLLENARYATKKLQHFGLCARPEAAIVSILIPEHLNLRAINYRLHQRGLFLNAIEYPAVPRNEQRLRVSIMVDHTRKDIDLLAETLEEAWNSVECQKPEALAC